MNNLVGLPQLTEESILGEVEARFKADSIYTYGSCWTRFCLFVCHKDGSHFFLLFMTYIDVKVFLKKCSVSHT